MTHFRLATAAFIRICGWAAVCLLAGTAVVAFAISSLGHTTALSVQTASMEPTFRPGDAVIIRRVNPASLQAGDIISYRNAKSPTMIITHRLIAKNATTGQFTTQGDHADQPDPIFPAQQLVGQAVAVVPAAGRLLDFLHRPLGLICLVYAPAGLIVGFEICRLIAWLRVPSYRAVHYR